MSLRTFDIDGVSTTTRTYRTGLIEHFTTIPGRSFLDLGASDGYESRAVAHLGASRVVSIEGHRKSFDQAKAAKEDLHLDHLEVQQRDVRFVDTYGLDPFDVVLCFGLLYHMANPFNVLKRIRAITAGTLLLETHVAPVTLQGLLPKLRAALPFAMHRVALDGVPFEGKLVRAPQAPFGGQPWSFWLTPESLLMAVTRAGFAVHSYYHQLDDLCPEPVKKWGNLLRFGSANTKVWLVATPHGPQPGVKDPSEHIIDGDPNWVDTPIEKLRRRWQARTTR